MLISALTWIPKYVFKVPPVMDPFDAIKNRKDLQYLDLPPDALQPSPRWFQAGPLKQPQIDKKTLEAMNKPRAPRLRHHPNPHRRRAVQPPALPPPSEQSAGPG